MENIPIVQALRTRCATAIEEAGTLKEKPLVRVHPEVLRNVCQAAKELGFDYLACITGVDYFEAGHFEVIYNLYSYSRGEHLVIKTRCPRETPVVPSVTNIWSSALFLERETYDLMGIRFAGHPDLKRILLPEPWVGHPLRKDYDLEKEQFVNKGPQGEDVVSFDSAKGW